MLRLGAVPCVGRILGCLELGLTPAEALWAATRGGAASLRRPDLGRLVPGARADVQVLDAETVLEVPYRVGVPLARTVLCAGVPVAGGGRA